MQIPHQSKKGHVEDNNAGSNACCNMDITPGIYIPQDDQLPPMDGENMDCNRSLSPLQQPPHSGDQTDGNWKHMETGGLILASRWFPPNLTENHWTMERTVYYRKYSCKNQ